MIDKARYEEWCSKITDERLIQIFRNSFYYEDLNVNNQMCIYDVIAAAVVLDENIITSSWNVRVDVQDDSSKSEYGCTFVTDNKENQTVRILSTVKAEEIFEMVSESIASLGGTSGSIKR